MPDIVSLGECMVEFFSDGPIAQAEFFKKTFGGDTLNVLVAAARLGSTTGFITKIGDDPFQEFLLSGWKQEGVDTSQVQVEQGGFNGIYFISLLEQGGREFTYYRHGSSPSKITPDELEPEYIGGAKFFHTSGISQAISKSAKETVAAAIQMAKEKEVRVSYDPNYRPQLWTPKAAQIALEQIIGHVDIILPSFPQITKILPQFKEEESLIRYFWEQGVGVVVVKKGSQGLIVGAKKKIEEIPPWNIKVVDTTGAGDAFAGAFLHGLVEGMDVFDAAKLGNITAALSTRGRGAVAPLPRREEVYQAFSTL